MTSPLAGLIEGVGQGFESGFGFRRANQASKAAQAQAQQQALYERAKQLREAVGFELAQRVANATLAKDQAAAAQGAETFAHTQQTWQQAAADRQKLSDAAAGIREQYGTNPSLAPLMKLPDEELVKQFATVAARPTKPPTFQRVQLEDGTYGWVPMPGTGEASPFAGAGQSPGVQAGTATGARPTTQQPTAPRVPVAPQGPSSMQYAGPGARAGGVLRTGVMGPEPAGWRQERTDAAYGVRAGVAEGTMRKIEMTDQKSVQQAARAINNPNFVSVIPFLGQRSAAAAKALREVGLSGNAVQYLNSLIEFSQNAAPEQFTPGVLRSPEMLYNMWTEFGAQPGEDPAGWEIKHRNRQNFVHMAKYKAGDRAWQGALKEFGVSDASLFNEPPAAPAQPGAPNPRFAPDSLP
jgi:hypothetical protein